MPGYPPSARQAEAMNPGKERHTIAIRARMMQEVIPRFGLRARSAGAKCRHARDRSCAMGHPCEQVLSVADWVGIRHKLII